MPKVIQVYRFCDSLSGWQDSADIRCRSGGTSADDISHAGNRQSARLSACRGIRLQPIGSRRDAGPDAPHRHPEQQRHAGYHRVGEHCDPGRSIQRKRHTRRSDSDDSRQEQEPRNHFLSLHTKHVVSLQFAHGGNMAKLWLKFVPVPGPGRRIRQHRIWHSEHPFRPMSGVSGVQTPGEIPGSGPKRRLATPWRIPGGRFAAAGRELLQDCLSFVTPTQQGGAVVDPGDVI